MEDKKKASQEEANFDIQQDKGTHFPEYIKTGEELLSLDIKEIPTLYGIFPLGGLSLIVGASDTGKSTILDQLALCTASGRNFLGREFNGQFQKAIAVSTEDDEIAKSYRISRQNRSLQICPRVLKNVRYIFDTEALFEKLEKELQRDPADLVVIDALGDVFNGKDLNANNQVRTFLQPYSTLAGKYKCAIVFLHHTSKRSEDLVPSKNNSIGSQGIEAKARFVAELRKSRFCEDIRHFCVVKGNYLPDKEKNSSIDIRLDKNLVFSDTGLRTNFENLVKNPSTRKAPEYQEDAEHIAFLKTIFRTRKDRYSCRELTEKIMEFFKVSDKTARKYKDMYIEKKWIMDGNSENGVPHSKRKRIDFIINKLE